MSKRYDVVPMGDMLDLDAVWQAATESVPALIAALQAILPAPPE
jgi:hypothetical protein